VNRTLASLLGALIGLLGFVAMLRLILAGVGPSAFALGFGLAAMVPWVGYVTLRTRRATLDPVRSVVALVCCAVGLTAVWLSSLGAVLGLALSLIGFLAVWSGDRAQRRI
jgi:hypothetical protein